MKELKILSTTGIIKITQTRIHAHKKEEKDMHQETLLGRFN